MGKSWPPYQFSRGCTTLIPIFVISLSDCTNRREMIAKRLNELSLPFQFLDAVDGRQGLPKEHEPLIDRHGASANRSYPLSDAEFANALSHMKAYRQVTDHGIPYAMILEDDAIPQPDLPRYLEGRHFEAFDISSLFYGKTYVRQDRAVRLFGAYESYPCEPGIPVRGAVGYIVSLYAAGHMTKRALPVISVSDWPVCTERFKAQNRWCLVHPRLVDHARRSEHGQPSIIRPTRIELKRRLFGVQVRPWNDVVRSLKWKLNYRSRGFRKINW